MKNDNSVRNPKTGRIMARDEWFKSDDGKIAYQVANDGFIHNALDKAFTAGWKACEDSIRKRISPEREPKK